MRCRHLGQVRKPLSALPTPVVNDKGRLLQQSRSAILCVPESDDHFQQRISRKNICEYSWKAPMPSGISAARDTGVTVVCAVGQSIDGSVLYHSLRALT